MCHLPTGHFEIVSVTSWLILYIKIVKVVRYLVAGTEGDGNTGERTPTTTTYYSEIEHPLVLSTEESKGTS